MNALAIRLPKLHEAQQRVVAEAQRFNVPVCGRRWGKSLLGEDRAIWTALQGDPVGWFAPTYKILSSAWRDILRITLPIQRRVNQTEHRIELVTGGVIECWSLDNRDAGRSRRYKRVIVDEAAMVTDLQATFEATIAPTLADLRGDAWFLSTPRGFDDYHKFYELGQDPEKPLWASWRLPTASNPHIAADELAALKQIMDARLFAQEFEASFEEMTGRVYVRFDRQANVRGDLIDTGGDILVGMDFNVAPMSACIAVKAGDQLHVLDEIELLNSNTDEMCRALRTRYPKRSITIFPDPSGVARKTSAPVGQTDFAIIKAAGFKLVAPTAAPPVVDRINEVNALAQNADGTRRLFVAPKCTSLIRGLMQLSYKDGQSVIDKSSGLDHMCFVGETPVATPDGPTPLASLRTAGVVGGPLGATEYVGAQRIANDAEVVRLVFENAEEVVCTPDHRFLTTAGWLCASELGQGEECLSVCGLESLTPFRNSTAFDTTSAVNTSGARGDSYIETCIARCTAASPTDMTCTISTATEVTMTRQICTRCRSRSMDENTCATWSAACRHGGISSRTPYRLLARGTDQTLGERGTGRMHAPMPPLVRIGLGLQSSAHTATARTWQRCQGDGSAPIIARRRPDGRLASITRRALASAAARNSSSIDTIRAPRVVEAARRAWRTKRVAQRRDAGRAAVFCLATPRVGAFALAAGLIVSNCDALGYMVHALFPLVKLDHGGAPVRPMGL